MPANQSAIILNHFKYVVKHVNGICFLKDLNGRYLAVSNELVQISNLPSSYILGKTDKDLPWNRLASRFINDDQLVIQSKISTTTCYLFEVRDGYHKIIRTTKEPIFDENNNVIGIFAQARKVLLPFEELLNINKSLTTFKLQNNNSIRLSSLEIKLFLLIVAQVPINPLYIIKLLGENINSDILLHIIRQLQLKIQTLDTKELEALCQMIGLDYIDESSIKYLINQFNIR